WLESHPNDTLKANWKYYLDEAEQTPEVAENLRILRSQSPVKSPEDIRLIDPCMGSGHILVYAFDVLMQIYESEGYNPRDAARSILEKNIYGLDIDRRAYQLAYFALMMKARQYNRRAFDPTSPRPQVYHPAGWSDGEEYGSLVKVDTIPPKPQLPKDQLSIFDDYERDLRIWNFKRLLVQKYDVVVTNPPYMGSSGMSAKLSDFVKKNYPDSKSDLFAAFIEKCGELLKSTGYQAMITQHSWMFLSSYEKLRGKLIRRDIVNMAHLGARAFEEIGGEVVQTTSFVLSKRNTANFEATYVRLLNYNSQQTKEEAFLSGSDRYTAKKENFEKIPGCPMAYWVSDTIQDIFHKNKKIDDIANPRQGLATGNNDHYLRFWVEVLFSDFVFNCDNLQQFFTTGAKYVPYNKGGAFRKWYGNIENVIRFDKANYDMLQTVGNHLPSKEFYFKESITWSKVTSGGFSMRYVPKGSVFDVAGCSIFSDSRLKYLLGLSNSVLMQYLMNILSQTLNYEVGSVKSIPIIFDSNLTEIVERTVNQCISLSRNDWDSFETSWDFKCHPLVCGERTVASAFEKWERQTADR
ncbi:MAG: N-6 DNA methylase, partial [Oligella ureolytica]|nr:N-6 DNA methylase [Oligella ureolytica]